MADDIGLTDHGIISIACCITALHLNGAEGEAVVGSYLFSSRKYIYYWHIGYY